MEETKKLLMSVSFDEVNDCYEVTIPQGSNALECVFGMAVIVKLFERDGLMTKDETLSNLNKYLNDPQYNELRS